MYEVNFKELAKNMVLTYFNKNNLDQPTNLSEIEEKYFLDDEDCFKVLYFIRGYDDVYYEVYYDKETEEISSRIYKQ